MPVSFETPSMNLAYSQPAPTPEFFAGDVWRMPRQDRPGRPVGNTEPVRRWGRPETVSAAVADPGFRMNGADVPRRFDAAGFEKLR